MAIGKSLSLAIFCNLALLVFGMGPAVRAASNTKIEGSVSDITSGLPVIAATISLAKTEFGTLSDNQGNFNLENVPAGKYDLVVSSVGYKACRTDNIEISPDMPVRIDIELEPVVYILPSLKVYGERIKMSDVGATIIDKRAIDESHASSLADLLADVDGVQIETAGPSGSRSEVKIRGSKSSDVLVLLDGQRINGPSDGSADLSSIPLDMVERIEIIKGGASAVYGPDALSGAINIITQSPALVRASNASFSRDWGSWASDKYKAGLQSDWLDDRLSTKLSFTKSQSDGAFPYSYAVQPQNKVYQGQRANNGYDKYDYFLSGQYQLSKSRSIGFSGQYYRDRHGLPGAASQPSLTAYGLDRRLTGTATLDLTGGASHGARLTAGYTRLEQQFAEPDINLPPPVRFDNRYIDDIYDLHYLHKLLLPGRIETQVGGQVRYEFLDHKDFYAPRFSMNQSTRNNYGVYLSSSRSFTIPLYGLVDRASIGGAMRYDITRTIKDSTSVRDTVTTNGTEYLSPRLSVAVGKSGALAYNLSSSYGRSLKIPPINALFWQGDAVSGGNPGLKPEKSEQYEFGFKFSYENRVLHLSSGVTLFENTIEDIIVWMPLYGGWRPVNRNSARITGRDDFVAVGLFNDHIKLDYKNTGTTPLNKTPGHNTYDKDLPFSPRYISSYSVSFDFDYLYGSYTSRKSGRAFTNEAATKYYDAYRVDNARLGGKYELKKGWTFEIDLNFNNIRDENYVLIAHYPMPGYSWGISCGVKYAP